MAITYHDLFNGANQDLLGRSPDTVGTAPWQLEAIPYAASRIEINGAGAAVAMDAEGSVILAGDAPENENHEVVVEGVFHVAAGRFGAWARASGVLADGYSGATRNGYALFITSTMHLECVKITAGVASEVTGYPGSGLTNLGTAITDNIKLKLVTRNSGADVEIEVWYNINDAGWSQVQGSTAGVFTDVAPGATFTDPGLDGLELRHGSASTDLSVLSFYSNGLAGGAADTEAPTIGSFTIPTPNVTGTTIINITSFTASDNVGVTGYMITESATPPLEGDGGWAGTAPTTYDLATNRSATLYPWAKDAAGNVSAVYGSPIAVSSSAGGSNAAPVVTNIAVADASLIDSHVFTITITATDDVGVTGYALSTTSTPPGASQQAGNVFNFDPGSFGDYFVWGWAYDVEGAVSGVAAPVAIRSVDSAAGGTSAAHNPFNGGFVA